MKYLRALPVQMDGLARSNALVFVLAATNLPWELDMAMLRRLEKRIFVALPDTGARLRILDTLLGGRCGPGVTLQQVADSTEGYSGTLGGGAGGGHGGDVLGCLGAR